MAAVSDSGDRSKREAPEIPLPAGESERPLRTSCPLLTVRKVMSWGRLLTCQELRQIGNLPHGITYLRRNSLGQPVVPCLKCWSRDSPGYDLSW